MAQKWFVEITTDEGRTFPVGPNDTQQQAEQAAAGVLNGKEGWQAGEPFQEDARYLKTRPRPLMIQASRDGSETKVWSDGRLEPIEE